MKNDKMRAFMLIFKVGLISVVLLAGGYVFVDVMTIAKPMPKKDAKAVAGAKVTAPTAPKGTPAPTSGVAQPEVPTAPKKGPTPFAALNQALAMPGQMVSQAKAVVEKSDERTHTLDRVIVESEKPALAAGGELGVDGEAGALERGTNSKALAAALGDRSKTADVKAIDEEAVVKDNPLIVATPDASPSFRAWVGKAHITSVVNGTPPSIVINGVLVRGGQVANANLGITFDSLDTANKKIVFLDKGGAMILLTH